MSMTTSGTTWVLTQPYDTQKLYCGAQTLNFLQIHCLFTDSVVVGPVKPARFYIAEAKSPQVKLCHQCNELISHSSGRKTVTSPSPISYGGAM